MNALGWSRARAMRCMYDHTFKSQDEIAAETLRYATDIPGQALGYKMGELTLLSLREMARRALGSRFDIRSFHQWVVGAGELPLTVLHQNINWEFAHNR